MRRALAIALTLGTPVFAFAETVVETTFLLPTTASDLGFQVEVLAGHAEGVQLTGPRIGPNGCPAARMGAAWYSENDDPLFMNSSYVGEAGRDPVVVATNYRQTARTSVWIDYLCSGDQPGESRRYAIRNADLFR